MPLLLRMKEIFNLLFLPHAGPGGQKVRIIALPEFRKTGTAVLVDLATLEPQLLQFDAALN